MQKLKYKSIGLGSKTIILMHEWMGDTSNYEPIYPYINIKDFTWIFVDFRGFGLSYDIKGQFSLDEAVSDIKNLIDTLSLKKVSLVGHSMSSFIAQKIAIQINDILDTLILVAPILPSGIKMKEEAKNKLLNEVKTSCDLVIKRVVKSASKRYNKVWEEKRINLAKSCSQLEAKYNYMNMYLSEDFSSEVKSKGVKVRVLTGKDDFLTFQKISLEKKFEKIYEDFTLVECAQAGHYPMIECPVFFANIVEKFINE